MIDRPLPQNRDLTGHALRIEGAAPKITHIAVFDYADGSQREFDGAAWTVTRPSRKASRLQDERATLGVEPHTLGAWNGLA